MEKLSEIEKAFIRGIFTASIIPSVFTIRDSYYDEDGMMKFLSQELPAKKSEMTGAYELTRVLKKEVPYESIKSAIYDENFNRRKEYFERNLLKSGILAWFASNMIVQTKRPDTLGNSGDYVGFDEEKDSFYRNNPLFVKFSNMEEYETYLNALEGNEDDYSEWFENNDENIETVSLV